MPYAIVEAPSNLGLVPTGVEQLADRLLSYGLAERLDARGAERVDVPAYDAQRDRETGTLNSSALAALTPRLADAVARVLDRGELPVVLGGDCSIVLGSMLALRRRGRYGLLYLDGHADFYQPDANPNGEAASMDLAFATGYGPKQLTDFEGRAPLVRAEDVVVFGYRDADEQREYGSQPLPRELRAFDLATIRSLGIERASRDAIAHLVRDELSGFFVHLDVDVLDDEIMPAVDYRLPGGLTWDELAVVLRTAFASARVAGIEITIYNPVLDRDGSSGRRLVDVIAETMTKTTSA